MGASATRAGVECVIFPFLYIGILIAFLPQDAFVLSGRRVCIDYIWLYHLAHTQIPADDVGRLRHRHRGFRIDDHARLAFLRVSGDRVSALFLLTDVVP